MAETRRILTALLALLTVGGTLLSCGDGETVDTSSVSNGVETESVAEETEDLYKPNLPDTDFEGKEIHILAWHRDTDPLVTDFAADSETGDPVLDSVYLRNSMIEERYNVDIIVDERDKNQIYGVATTALMAQEDLWHFMESNIFEMNSMTQGGYLQDLTGLENLDLSQEWWDQRYVEDMSIGGKLYTILGDINIFDNIQTWGFIYNKKLAYQFDLGNLYDLVWDGTWTLDQLNEYIKIAAADLDGDGDMDENDRWGMMTESTNLYFHLLGTGGRVSKNGDDGYPQLTLNTERNATALEKAHGIMIDTERVMQAENWTHLHPSVIGSVMIPMFKNDQSLFYFAAVGWGYCELRDMETEFGILPVPKLDEAQSEYYNGVSQYWATSIGIPVTCAEPDTSAFIMEAMSAASVQTVTKAFNEVVFNSKGLRDEESVEIMKLINKSRVYDIAYLNNWGSIQDRLRTILKDNPLQFASSYAKWEKGLIKALENTIKSYEEME